MRHARFASVAAFTFATAGVFNPAEAAVRAFVSSTGNDANTASSCGATTPCRGFTAALSVVDDGGEIIALDAAGYGAVTITTKSVSIIANPGVYAGVAASSGIAITVNAPGKKVSLRGLAINNTGSATNGINMTNGDKLDIDNCTFSNFTAAAVNIASAAEVRITNSTFRDSFEGVIVRNEATATIAGSRFSGHSSGNGAVVVKGGLATTTTSASVTDSTFSHNYAAVWACASTAGAATQVAVSRSNLTNNFYAAVSGACSGTADLVVVDNNLISGSFYNTLYQGPGGVIQSRGNNTFGFGAGNVGVISGATAY